MSLYLTCLMAIIAGLLMKIASMNSDAFFFVVCVLALWMGYNLGRFIIPACIKKWGK
jgi:hypothetical protein